MKHFRKQLCALLAAALILCCGATAFGTSVKVNSDAARLYKSASSSSDSVPLEKGLSLTLKDASGDWGKVSYKGVTGYVPLKYLNSGSRYTAYISKDTHIYKSASSSSDKASISANTKVYVVGVSGDYLRVQNASGSATGYVPADCVSRSKGASASSGRI